MTDKSSDASQEPKIPAGAVSPDGKWRWDGSEWSPLDMGALPTSTPQPQEPDPSSTGESASQILIGRIRRTGKAGKFAFIAVPLLLIGGIASAIVVGSSSSGTSDGSSSDASSGTSIVSPTETCGLEANTVLDILLGRQGSASEIQYAIGTQSRLYTIATENYGTFLQYESQGGEYHAQQEIASTLRTACDSAGDPILSQAQVTALSSYASPGDVSSLNSIGDFGPAS